jgi:hypothetical protein
MEDEALSVHPPRWDALAFDDDLLYFGPFALSRER